MIFWIMPLQRKGDDFFCIPRGPASLFRSLEGFRGLGGSADCFADPLGLWKNECFGFYSSLSCTKTLFPSWGGRAVCKAICISPPSPQTPSFQTPAHVGRTPGATKNCPHSPAAGFFCCCFFLFVVVGSPWRLSRPLRTLKLEASKC